MYFPYLRGKQNELLALKEMSDVLGQARKIIPIIEPVRVPDGSGLDRCITALANSTVEFILVVNPTVGSLKQNSTVSEILSQFINRDSNRSSIWNLGLIIEEHTNIQELFQSFRDSFPNHPTTSLIHKKRHEELEELLNLSASLNRRFDIIDSNLKQRHFRDFLSPSKPVTLSDPFPKQDRNSDFVGVEESMFTEEHLYLEDDHWYGFSDYLTIGEAYIEGGFTPRAVVIHWTYQRESDGAIMIRHFASDDYTDTSNVAGKFLEALDKLVSFLNERDIRTLAADSFREYQRNRNYPGLGILKKLSIKNHLELVSNILSR